MSGRLQEEPGSYRNWPPTDIWCGAGKSSARRQRCLAQVLQVTMVGRAGPSAETPHQAEETVHGLLVV